MIFLSVKPILQYIENMIVSASKWLHFKSNISSFSDTFYTNFLHEHINSLEIELATWNRLLLRRSWSLFLFSLLQRNVLNSETEGTLLLSFSNILGIGELPCFALHLLSYFMEGNKLSGSLAMMIFVALLKCLEISRLIVLVKKSPKV